MWASVFGGVFFLIFNAAFFGHPNLHGVCEELDQSINRKDSILQGWVS
jgi:hypothetical protein